VKNDILVSSVGTIGVAWLVENNDPFYFKDGNLTWLKNYSDKINGPFLHQWIVSKETQNQIKSSTIGSTQQALTISALRTLRIALPKGKSSIMDDISKKLTEWNELRLLNKNEINTLTTLRDTLLPKLISGEVRIKDIENQVAQAL
jgi:type I restriction enzyme S subunit